MVEWSDLKPNALRIPEDYEDRIKFCAAVDAASTRTPRDLTDDEVRDVRTLRAQGVPRVAIAHKHGIKRSAVSAIVSRTTRARVPSAMEVANLTPAPPSGSK